MKKSKQSRAREFTQKERKLIKERDRNQCIFCAAGWETEGATSMALSTLSIMHYIPRSQNGLGIQQNGAVGCQYHHELMDNGNKGNRKEMLDFFREYLKSKYADWKEEELVYSKWKFLQ